MFSKIQSFLQGFQTAGDLVKPIFLLGVRLFWGFGFLLSGLGKLNNFDKTVEFFKTINIPLPELSVYLTAYTEAIGGALLIVGLLSRVAAVPLIITMAVAYLTAHHEALFSVFSDPDTFVKQAPFNFLLAALIVFCFGAGTYSLDALFSYLFGNKKTQK